jgi:hypothetical protein
VSDHLHRAVQAEIAARTPSRWPSFEALKARKKARDRRRGLAAASASALAVAGVAFLPSMLGSSAGPETRPPVGEGLGNPAVFDYRVRAEDVPAFQAAGADALTDLEVCLQYPGLSDGERLESDPAQYSGRVTGQDQAQAFQACVQRVPGMTATLTPEAEQATAMRETAAVRPSEGFLRQALAIGILRADDATGCLWIERGGKPTAELLLAGESHRVDFSTSPPVVWKGEQVVATVGTEVRFGGGYTERHRGVEGCPIAGEGIFFGAFSEQQERFAELRRGCAPNDAAAVLGVWNGPAAGEIWVVDADGVERGSVPATPGRFIIRLRYSGLPEMPARGEVQWRDSSGQVVERQPVPLRNDPPQFCG